MKYNKMLMDICVSSLFTIFMTSIIVCWVPISEWYTISIGAPLSAGRRGPDLRDFVATIGCCRLDPSPCCACGSLDDLPTTPPNIAGCFLVHM